MERNNNKNAINKHFNTQECIYLNENEEDSKTIIIIREVLLPKQQ